MWTPWLPFWAKVPEFLSVGFNPDSYLHMLSTSKDNNGILAILAYCNHITTVLLILLWKTKFENVCSNSFLFEVRLSLIWPFWPSRVIGLSFCESFLNLFIWLYDECGFHVQENWISKSIKKSLRLFVISKKFISKWS